MQVGAFLFRGFKFLSVGKYENTKNVIVMSSDVTQDTCLFKEENWCHMRILTCGIVLKLDKSRLFFILFLGQYVIILYPYCCVAWVFTSTNYSKEFANSRCSKY